jgi:hypothetical protein
MSDGITPGGVAAGFWRWFWVGVCCLALLGVLIWVGSAFGWWLSSQNATRQYQITQNGTSNQDTLRGQIGKGFQQITAEDVQVAQAKAAGNTNLVGQIRVEEAAQAGVLCSDMEQVSGVPLPADQAAWNTLNCVNGTVAPASVYYIPLPS